MFCMNPDLISRATAVLGGLVFAGAGATMGSMNAGWFGLEPNANALFPLLGAGVLLLAVPWVRAGWPRTLWELGLLGKAAAVLLVLAPALLLLNPVLQFAIFGTLGLGIGLALLTATLWQQRVGTKADRVMATLAVIASLSWNTETLSAFLLAAVGLLLATVSVRLDGAETR